MQQSTQLLKSARHGMHHARAGLSGPVLQGTAGHGPHLTGTAAHSPEDALKGPMPLQNSHPGQHD